MRVTGSITAGKIVRLTAASFQSVLTSTNSSASALNHCRKKSASICDVASCTLSISFMIDDISRPVECASKKSAPFRSTFSKTEFRRSVTEE